MHSPKVLADRFKVFSYVKRIKKEEDRIPSYDEIADMLGVPLGSVGAHINALRRADGFPRYPKYVGGKAQREDGTQRAPTIGNMRSGFNFDENALLLTDIFAVTDG